MTIHTIQFRNLRNSEHVQFVKAIKHVFGENSPEALHVKDQYDTFVEGIDKMDTVFVTAQGSVITNALISQDDIRDAYISGLISVIKAYFNHFSEEKVRAAKLLYTHIRKYGKRIDKMNYNAETATLSDLIDGIENNTVLTAAAELLGISDWFAELKASNIEFNRLYDLRANEEAGKIKLVLKELREESKGQYRELIKYFEAASIMHPSDVYETVANKLNEYIDKYNNLRRKLNSDEDEDTE